MSKYSHLDGLRGVASFIVVIFHFFILGFYPNSTNNLYSFCQNNLPYPLDELFFYNLFNFVDGKLAVFIFWVMSAYVISIKLFRNNKNSSREYLISGASKRYLRLFLPCSASILFAYLLMKFGLIFNDDAVIHFKQNLDNNWMKNLYEFSPTFFSAVKSAFWDTFFNFKEVPCYNTVLWTMEKEFFGSLFCFLAFFIIPLNHYRSIFYFILLILFIYFNLIWMISFLVGYILCDMDHSNMNDNVLEKFKKMEKWLFSNHKFFTSLGLLLITIIIKPFLAQFASYYVVNITTAILVVYLVLKIEMCYNFFNIRLFQWLGKISFSLYLVHVPIMCSLCSFTSLKLPYDNIFLQSLNMFFWIIFSLVIAQLFNKLIDERAVKISNDFGKFILRCYYYGLFSLNNK